MSASATTGREPSSIERVADGVHFVEGPASNWVVLSGDGTVSLIDAGYPGDVELVRASLREVAGDAPLQAIAVTHGHSDHTGSINPLLAEHPGAVVLTGSAEVPNVRRDVTYQVTAAAVLPHLIKPRFAKWLRHAIRAGGLQDVAVSAPEGLDADATITLSGHTVRVRATPGHTPGHTAYELPGAHAVATGDALVTGHAVSRTVGPQALHPMFHHDRAGALALAGELAREWSGWTLLPGHGPLLRAAPAR